MMLEAHKRRVRFFFFLKKTSIWVAMAYLRSPEPQKLYQHHERRAVLLIISLQRCASNITLPGRQEPQKFCKCYWAFLSKFASFHETGSSSTDREPMV